jgi:hypothetical protein
MTYVSIAIAFTWVFWSASAVAQCTKDIECKGERVCERGTCSAPVKTPQVMSPVMVESPIAPLKKGAAYPKFEDFPVSRHPGPFTLPKGVRRVNENEWRNELGKLVDPPRLNLAGKYAVVLNSCGSSCRYYTLTDLTSGRDLSVLNVFASAEPRPVTKEGFPYVTDLVTRMNSAMLVAQYHVKTETVGIECRERIFVLDNEKLRPISNTKIGCSSF